MNRGIAVLVALALLLAHSLAIYNDAGGAFAPPADRVYAAYRLAHNLIHDGQLAWNADQVGIESYPSLLLVLLSAIPERLFISVNLFHQVIGIVASLVTLMLVSLFSTRRGAGLIAPLLLAVSGGMAAAAGNGSETALFTMLWALAFAAFEKGWPKRLGLALVAACMTHPGGVVLVLGLCLARRGPQGKSAGVGWTPFVLAALSVGALALLRLALGGHLVSPAAAGLATPAGDFASLSDFLVSYPGTWLALYPLWYLVRGRLSVLGRHASILTILWLGYVVLQGSLSAPFYETIVPCLPTLVITLQEGMTEALDCGMRFARRAAIVVFAVVCATSAAASKSPTHVGPSPIKDWHNAWLRPFTPGPFGHQTPLGRKGLQNEILATERLRAIGIFLRDNRDDLERGRTVLSPWPGSLGYLTRLPVTDLLGRTDPSPGNSRLNPWTGGQRVDVVAAIERQPAFIVAFLNLTPAPPRLSDVAANWIEHWDSLGEQENRLEAIEAALGDYELVAIPIFVHYRGVRPSNPQTYYLLRNLRLELRPELELGVGESEVRIEVRHRGHPQLVKLRLAATDETGQEWWMRPTGELTQEPGVYVRTTIQLYKTGSRSIELLRNELSPPNGARIIELRAQLFNPGSAEEPGRFAAVSDEVVHRF